MRVNLWMPLLCLIGACNTDEPDRFHPLTEMEKHILPLKYETGDTLSFLYSDSVSTDTQRFVLQPLRSYLNSLHVPETGYSDYFEVLEWKIKSLNGNTEIILAVGNVEVDYFDTYKYFYVAYNKFWYGQLLNQFKGNYGTREFRMHWAFADIWHQDSVYMQYSIDSGLMKFQDFDRGYTLERMP